MRTEKRALCLTCNEQEYFTSLVSAKKWAEEHKKKHEPKKYEIVVSNIEIYYTTKFILKGGK